VFDLMAMCGVYIFHWTSKINLENAGWLAAWEEDVLRSSLEQST